MFHHVVMMRISKTADRTFHDKVEHHAARVRKEISGLVSYDYGENGADRGKGFDFAIISVFEGEAAHDAYQTSAVHVELSDYMTPFIEDMVVCDLTAAT